MLATLFSTAADRRTGVARYQRPFEPQDVLAGNGVPTLYRRLAKYFANCGFATLGCLVLGSLMAVILVFILFPGSQLISRVIDTFIALPTFLITLAFTFIYGSAGLLNGTLMSLFDFALPPVDFSIRFRA